MHTTASTQGVAIAVTGMGCMTPCGNSVASFWKSMVEGRSGVSLITSFDTTAFDVHIAGEVKDFDPIRYGINVKDARRLDRCVQFGIAAAREAVEHPGPQQDPRGPGQNKGAQGQEPQPPLAARFLCHSLTYGHVVPSTLPLVASDRGQHTTQGQGGP